MSFTFIKWISNNRAQYVNSMLDRSLGSDQATRQGIVDVIDRTIGLYSNYVQMKYVLDKSRSMHEGTAEGREKIKSSCATLKELEGGIKRMLGSFPNVLDKDVPMGKDPSDNVYVSMTDVYKLPTEGNICRISKHLLDFGAGAVSSGSGYVFLRGNLAKLERCLSQFMFTFIISQGFLEVNVPLLVKEEMLYASGQLPKFAEGVVRMAGGNYLIPTSEVSLLAQHYDQILDIGQLPLRYTALTPCFRDECGSTARESGLIRVPQFHKVEMVSIVAPEDEEREFRFILDCAMQILQLLELPYRAVKLCSGDLGFSAKKTVDLEAWLPSQGRYLEVSSCSTCGTFQAMRMQLRCRDPSKENKVYPVTLNGSGLAVGRTLLAIIENNMVGDIVKIPEVLQPLFGAAEMSVST